MLLDCHACSYAEGLALQDQVRSQLPSGTLHGLAFEHPPTFTFGRHATPDHLLVTRNFLEARGVTLLQTDRGGEVTFHGPGQMVVYPVFRLGGLAVKRWVWLLEEAMVGTLARVGVAATRGDGPGVFVVARDQPKTFLKIAFIGLRIRDGVSTHGISLNVSGDLQPFSWMNPCGTAALPVTSVERATGVAPHSLPPWRELARVYMDTLAALLVGERA